MSRVLPYLLLMRLHQPTGVFLLLWPCWWGIMLAGKGNAPLMLLATFAIGAVVMRSAGCIVNDIIDRDLDKHVERTKDRPLANGTVTLTQASLLLFLLLVIAFLIALTLNRLVLMLAISSLILVAAYPFMKRITWWPQAFLGFTFNWGALMGWAAVTGNIRLPAVFLYIGGIFWTLGYDTIYAHQDKADDVKVGIKSTAIRLQENSTPWIAAAYFVAVIHWAVAGMLAGKSLYYLGGLGLVAAHFIWQIYAVNLNDSTSCLKIFRSNSVLGLLVFLSLFLA